MRPEWLLVALLGAGGAVCEPAQEAPSGELLEFLGGRQVGNKGAFFASFKFLDEAHHRVNLAEQEVASHEPIGL